MLGAFHAIGGSSERLQIAAVEAAQVRDHIEREAQALLEARQNDCDDHVLELSDIVEADQQSIDRVAGAARGDWTRPPSSASIDLGQAVRLGNSLKRFGGRHAVIAS